jgi:hypothetical protein
MRIDTWIKKESNQWLIGLIINAVLILFLIGYLFKELLI